MGNTTKYTFKDATVPLELIMGALKDVPTVILKILYKRGYRTTEALTRVLFDNIDWSLSHTELRDIESYAAVAKGGNGKISNCRLSGLRRRRLRRQRVMLRNVTAFRLDR